MVAARPKAAPIGDDKYGAAIGHQNAPGLFHQRIEMIGRFQPVQHDQTIDAFRAHRPLPLIAQNTRRVVFLGGQRALLGRHEKLPIGIGPKRFGQRQAIAIGQNRIMRPGRLRPDAGNFIDQMRRHMGPQRGLVKARQIDNTVKRRTMIP